MPTNHPILSLADMPTRLKAIRVPDPNMALDRETVLAWILEDLWTKLAHPVLDALAIIVSL